MDREYEWSDGTRRMQRSARNIIESAGRLIKDIIPEEELRGILDDVDREEAKLFCVLTLRPVSVAIKIERGNAETVYLAFPEKEWDNLKIGKSVG